MQGDPGDGKSTFILNVAALLTQGRSMPDGFATDAHTVVYQCTEDNLADTVKPRLMAAGANCSKVAYILEGETQLTLDDSRIEETIRATSARMFVLDPLQSFLLQDGDMQSAVRMRNLLRKLGTIAAKYNCAVILVCHMNKAGNGKNLYRSLGSIDIAAIARSILMISRDESDGDIRCMFPVKSSLAQEGAGIGFVIDEHGCLQWTEIPRGFDEHETEDGKKMLCRMKLGEMLKEHAKPSNDVLDCLIQIGISRRTVFTVKKQLGIQSFRKGGVWYWQMTDKMSEAEDAYEEEF